MLRVAAAIAIAGLAVAAGPAALADPAPAPSYRHAVQEAYDLIRDAAPDDSVPAQRAAAVLVASTGQSQSEIMSDLVRRPPDYQDAKDRLTSLMQALDQPARTAEPAVASQRLHDVLSMSRYNALHRPPSVIDRAEQWLRARLDDLLRFLGGNRGGSQVPGQYFYAVGIITLVAVAIVVFRSTRGRFAQAVAAARPAGPRPPADDFAEADRRAATGDRVGAIRALCAGVAATLAGERTWEGSPLTVREIFQRAPDAASLHPLLAAFEAAIYGGRDVDSETYRRANLVAAPYRSKPEAVAA